jgi:hypothetical protein
VVGSPFVHHFLTDFPQFSLRAKSPDFKKKIGDIRFSMWSVFVVEEWYEVDGKKLDRFHSQG